jgi:hypothetical protein
MNSKKISLLQVHNVANLKQLLINGLSEAVIEGFSTVSHQLSIYNLHFGVRGWSDYCAHREPLMVVFGADLILDYENKWLALNPHVTPLMTPTMAMAPVSIEYTYYPFQKFMPLTASDFVILPDYLIQSVISTSSYSSEQSEIYRMGVLILISKAADLMAECVRKRTWNDDMTRLGVVLPSFPLIKDNSQHQFFTSKLVPLLMKIASLYWEENDNIRLRTSLSLLVSFFHDTLKLFKSASASGDIYLITSSNSDSGSGDLQFLKRLYQNTLITGDRLFHEKSLSPTKSAISFKCQLEYICKQRSAMIRLGMWTEREQALHDMYVPHLLNYTFQITKLIAD